MLLKATMLHIEWLRAHLKTEYQAWALEHLRWTDMWDISLEGSFHPLTAQGADSPPCKDSGFHVYGRREG